MAGQIKLAIVGCGNQARFHAACLAAVPEAQVVALCDINPQALDRYWHEQFNGDKNIRRYTDFDKLIKDPPKGLRAVVLVTPHTVHFPQAMLALANGYDVLVEKPMVTSSSHARQLAQQIKKTGRQLQVAFQAPYTAEFAYIREQIQRGVLGELQTISAVSHQNWTTLSAGTWRQNPKLSGGGQMYDTGAHVFNAIAWLIDRPVVEVYCQSLNKGTPVDINATMTIRWEGDVLGSVTISGNTPGWQEGIWIAGEKGRIATGIHGGRLEHYDQKGHLIKYPRVTQTNYTPIANFVYSLLGMATPCCPVRYGILHSWLMDALYKSAKTHKPVKLTEPPLKGFPPPPLNRAGNRKDDNGEVEFVWMPC